jgi:peptide deformylase
MPARRILLYPDPFLRRVCRPVAPGELGGAELLRLADDLVSTMYAEGGAVGLAAPQIGSDLRVFAMDETARTTRDALRVLVNPELVSLSQWKFSREGCLSFPDYLVTVKRARRALVRWLTPEGTPMEEELRDFPAIIAQHEADHLDGVLFVDRMRNPQTDLVLRSEREATPAG